MQFCESQRKIYLLENIKESHRNALLVVLSLRVAKKRQTNSVL